MPQKMLMGFNTRNISTSYRTNTAVTIGSLKGSGLGSTTRIYKWCHQHTEDPISCVFQQQKISQNDILSWLNISDLLPSNLGNIIGNIGLNGQIIIGGGNGGQLQFSSNLGKTWSPYPNSPNLPDINTQPLNVIPWSSVVMSDNTQYVIGVPYVPTDYSFSKFTTYNGIYYTTDSGLTWTLLQSCPIYGGTLDFNDINNNNNSLLFIDAGISQDGQYMAVLTTPRQSSGLNIYLIISKDYGTTWTAYSIDPYNTPYYVTTFASSISIANTSSSNDYLMVTSKLVRNQITSSYENGTCCISTDGGNSFSVPTDISGNDFIYSSLSDDGKNQVCVSSPNTTLTPIPGRLYLSRNYGNNFNQIIELPYIDIDNYQGFGGVSMSADGKYITASVLDQDGILQFIYISNDNGNTWKQIKNDSNGISFIYSSQLKNLGFLNTNYSGQYQMITGLNSLYINNNYGN